MKQVLQSFIEALFDFADGDSRMKQTIQGEDYKAKITINDGTFMLVIHKELTDSDCNKGSDSDIDPKEALACKIKQSQCFKLREEFHQYINSFDKSLFVAICKTIDPETLSQLNANVEENDTDPTLMSESIETFKSTADKVIMEKVSELKSQMTNSYH